MKNRKFKNKSINVSICRNDSSSKSCLCVIVYGITLVLWRVSPYCDFWGSLMWSTVLHTPMPHCAYDDYRDCLCFHSYIYFLSLLHVISLLPCHRWLKKWFEYELHRYSPLNMLTRNVLFILSLVFFSLVIRKHVISSYRFLFLCTHFFFC